MANRPVVDVGGPNALGWRKVTIDDKPAGQVRSVQELQKLLRHAGVPFEIDIRWHGGDANAWPDRACRRRVYGLVMAVGLLATAYVFVRIGASDTFTALTYPGRITGFIFLLTALAEVAAAAATFDYWGRRDIKYSGTVILIGTAAALTASAVLLIMQVRGGKYTPWLLLWCVLVPWSLWALSVLVRDRAWKGLPNPRRIAIGVVISTLLAFANLAYTHVYVPYTTAPLIEITATFGTATFNDERTKLFVPFHLQVKNSGQIPVYVLGSIYWVRGQPLSTKPQDARKQRLLSSDEFIQPSGRPLNPGEEWAEDEVALIDGPREAPYETLKIETEAWVARKDRMAITTDYVTKRMNASVLVAQHLDKDPPGPEPPYFRYQGSVKNSNEILNMTRGRQRITLWHTTNSQPYLYVNLAPPDEKKPFVPTNPTADEKNSVRYGLTKVRGSMTQKPFAELLEKAEAQADRRPPATTPPSPGPASRP
ncbi:hypothetical protein BX286_1330 [Streptomyces sp. 3211.6]|uniref:hypothetical protein n=1 Tax=Streptomyces sp. 3211.6 TaxID=1938845 RepID=UPI000EAD78CD|nr:hypothetical protein [Streptomyces sp. 3211.6]RKT03403.1 hypothetical protein BX286_1330 [Streptomyces sp. 3211.6]